MRITNNFIRPLNFRGTQDKNNNNKRKPEKEVAGYQPAHKLQVLANLAVLEREHVPLSSVCDPVNLEQKQLKALASKAPKEIEQLDVTKMTTHDLRQLIKILEKESNSKIYKLECRINPVLSNRLHECQKIYGSMLAFLRCAVSDLLDVNASKTKELQGNYYVSSDNFARISLNLKTGEASLFKAIAKAKGVLKPDGTPNLSALIKIAILHKMQNDREVASNRTNV